jgi:hypothetical protein
MQNAHAFIISQFWCSAKIQVAALCGSQEGRRSVDKEYMTVGLKTPGHSFSFMDNSALWANGYSGSNALMPAPVSLGLSTPCDLQHVGV